MVLTEEQKERIRKNRERALSTVGGESGLTKTSRKGLPLGAVPMALLLLGGRWLLDVYDVKKRRAEERTRVRDAAPLRARRRPLHRRGLEQRRPPRAFLVAQPAVAPRGDGAGRARAAARDLAQGRRGGVTCSINCSSLSNASVSWLINTRFPF